jgi:hypothetical protein
MGHVVPADLAERLPGMLDRPRMLQAVGRDEIIPRVIFTTMPDSGGPPPANHLIALKQVVIASSTSRSGLDRSSFTSAAAPLRHLESLPVGSRR